MAELSLQARDNKKKVLFKTKKLAHAFCYCNHEYTHKSVQKFEDKGDLPWFFIGYCAVMVAVFINVAIERSEQLISSLKSGSEEKK